VNNAVKHARSTTVTISLIRESDALVLTVSDDGSGLARNAAKSRGLGLGVMQHRAKVIGADLTVNSKRGDGVTIHCRLPLAR
ncbi:MAG TPA: ATP-binding protein, partial [Opitutus sp.]|nr:ATP-binding protein [Opitutus sp.]